MNDPRVVLSPAPQRGAVLILVLFVLAGLAVLSVEFNRDVLLDHTLSVTTRSVLQARPALESGERVATALLLDNSRKGDPDHVHEDWNKLSLVLQQLSLELESATLSGSLSDENSLFPLNALLYTKESERPLAESFTILFTRLIVILMQQHGYEGGVDQAIERAERFVEEIRAWAGQVPLSATSRTWYLKQQPRRLPPKRRLLSPDELLLIHWEGVDERWKRQLILGTETVSGLVDLVTVWSDGPMNMNTLHPTLLAALAPDARQGQALASAVMRYRENPDNDFSDLWYRDLCAQYGFSVDSLPIGCLDVRSRWYRLTLDAQIGARHSQLISVGWVTHERVTWEYRLFR